MTKTTIRVPAPSEAVVGIDPGINGALALLDGGKFKAVVSMPVHEKKSGRREIDALGLYSQLNTWNSSFTSICILIERVAAMPGQGVSGMFSLGDSFGVIRGVSASITYQVDYATPVVWKKVAGLNKSKEYSLRLAREKFPDAWEFLQRKKDEGRAEALLLARYGFYHHSW